MSAGLPFRNQVGIIQSDLGVADEDNSVDAGKSL